MHQTMSTRAMSKGFGISIITTGFVFLLIIRTMYLTIDMIEGSLFVCTYNVHVNISYAICVRFISSMW